MNLGRSPGASCNQCEHGPPMIAITASDDCERLQVEIRRRWPNISETVLPATLERILAAPVEPPPTFRRSGDPVLDGRRRAMRR